MDMICEFPGCKCTMGRDYFRLPGDFIGDNKEPIFLCKEHALLSKSRKPVMQNKIEDLRNHLFAQLERLSDPDCDLDKENTRAAVMVSVAQTIIETGKLEVEYLKATTKDEKGGTGFFPIAKEERKYFIEK